MTNQSRFLFFSFVLALITQTAFTAKGLLGGYQTQTPSVCRAPFNQAELGKSAYLRKYFIVSCKSQVINGINYQVELKPFRGAQDSVVIVLYQPQNGPITVSSITEPVFVAQETGLMGGYRNAPLKECELVLQKTNFVQESHVKHYVVSTCQIQIVAGVNYKMTLLNREHESFSKEVVIYQDLQNNTHLSSIVDAFQQNSNPKNNKTYASADLKACSDALHSAVRSDSDYLSAYEIIECSTQQKAGKNYKMILRLKENDEMKRKIVINESRRKFRIVTNEVIEDSQPGMLMVGGYTHQSSVATCYKAIQNIPRDSFLHLSDFRLISCDTQVINGVNYKLTLKTPNDELCTFFIYQTSEVKPVFTVTDTESADDCHRLQ